MLLFERTLDHSQIPPLIACCHRLKGNSAAVGLADLEQLWHQLEELLILIHKSSTPATNDEFHVIRRCHQEMSQWAKALADDPDFKPATTAALKEVKGCVALRQWLATGAIEDHISQGPAPSTSAQTTSNASALLEFNHDSLKISVPFVESAIRDIERILSFAKEGGHRSKPLQQAEKLLELLATKLQRQLTLPVGSLFQKLEIAAREVSRRQKKQVAYSYGGADIEVAKGILDELGLVLIHIIRNAIDHGIERPLERQRAGKSTTGSITLKAEIQGGALIIVISDDGAGINGQALQKRAKAMGIATDRYSEGDCKELVFVSGLSSKSDTTAISGRGVGLSDVQTAIMDLGGTIRVTSKQGRGTTFVVRVPI